MERLIRIVNDDDRHTLAWLTTHAGALRVADAARHLAYAGRPVFVSALCRYLGMWPPARREPARAARDCTLADRHLAQMRRILAGTKPAIAPAPHR
jgi:AraC-like DNA-binding protein